MKVAVNSTIGTPEQKPLDQLILKDKIFVQSDKVYMKIISDVPEEGVLIGSPDGNSTLDIPFEYSGDITLKIKWKPYNNNSSLVGKMLGDTIFIATKSTTSSSSQTDSYYLHVRGGDKISIGTYSFGTSIQEATIYADVIQKPEILPSKIYGKTYGAALGTDKNMYIVFVSKYPYDIVGSYAYHVFGEIWGTHVSGMATGIFYNFINGGIIRICRGIEYVYDGSLPIGASKVYFPTTIKEISSTAFSGVGTSSNTTIYVPWSEGEIEGAPWGATSATIQYNYTDWE